MSEVVTNSVRHGGLREGQEISISAAARPGHVRVEVMDPGSGFVLPTGGPSADGASGWGFFLLDRLAHRWGAHRENGRTVVWFELPSDSR